MRVEEARKLVAVLMVTYPNYKPIDVELAAKTWADIAEEYTYEQMDTGLKLYMKSNTSGFPPVPGQIIDIIHNLTDPKELNEMEAWSLVQKAIKRSGSNCVEEFAKLPQLVQKAVGIPGQLQDWALTENLNKEVIMSNFQRAYKIELQRQKELKKMPQNIRDLIEKSNIGSPVAQIEQKRQETIKSAKDRKNDEIKALEMKRDSVPMPEKYQSKIDRWKNKE